MNAHDLFLLMVNLSQINDAGQIRRIFIEAIDQGWPSLRCALAEEGEGLPITKGAHRFGVLTFDRAAFDALEGPARANLRNAVGLLAVILEGREMAARLRAHNDALEDSFREQRAFLDSVIHVAPALIYLYDLRTGRNLFSNRSVGDLLGYTPEELQAMGEGFLIKLIHPDDISSVVGHHSNLTEAPRGEISELEYRVKRKDGGWSRFWSRDLPYRKGADGRTAQILGCAIDITRQADLQERLHQAQKMQAVGQLAGGIAHDFNNLLQGILGFNSLAIDSLEEGCEARGFLEEVTQASLRAADLVRQLLTFSRKRIPRREPLDLVEVINGVLRMLRRLIGADIEIVLKMASATDAISADRGMLEQLLINLLVNARDAMPDGGRVEVEVRRREVTGAWRASRPWAKVGLYTELIVRDTGVGMTPEVRERIFEPFFTTKPRGSGTGLGLATVYGIVQQHKAQMNVVSAPGEGACFHILFPTIEATPALTRQEPQTQLQRGDGRVVLLAEDEPAAREVARRILVGQGYKVLEAQDGREALTLFESHGARFDALILDLVMPHLGGLEVIRHARQRRPDLPVLLMTGYSERALDLDLGGQPHTDLLEKPCRPARLCAALQRLIDGASSTAEASGAS